VFFADKQKSPKAGYGAIVGWFSSFSRRRK